MRTGKKLPPGRWRYTLQLAGHWFSPDEAFHTPDEAAAAAAKVFTQRVRRWQRNREEDP